MWLLREVQQAVRCSSELKDSSHGSWDSIFGGRMLWPVALISFYTAPLISALHHSCCTAQYTFLSKEAERIMKSLLQILNTDLISIEEDGTQLTNRVALFLPHFSSAAENRMVMFQESILFVCLDPRKEPSVQALFFLWLAMLIYLPCCTPQKVCECSWLPQTFALGQHKHLFHADLRTESIPHSTPLSFLFNHSIPFTNFSHDPLSPVSLLPGDLHVSWSSSQKAIRK